MHQRLIKPTRKLLLLLPPRLFSDIHDWVKNFTVVVIMSAKYFLHKIPFFVPGSAVIFEGLVHFVLEGVYLVKCPLSSVFLCDIGMLNEIISLSYNIVFPIESIILYFGVVTSFIRRIHPCRIINNFFTTPDRKQLVPPSVDERHFEIIPWFIWLLTIVINSHADFLAVYFWWVLKVYMLISVIPAVFTWLNVPVSLHFAFSTFTAA